MARLTDPDRLAAYLDALNNWAVDGCVSFDRLSKEGANTCGIWVLSSANSRS